MDLTRCFRKTCRKAATVAVVMAAIPLALCAIGVWCYFVGSGGDIKSG